MEITRPTIDDVESILECWLALAAEQTAHGSRLHVADNREVVADEIAKHVVSQGLLVAVDPEPVGFVMYERQAGRYSQRESVGSVTALYVQPAARGESIGSQLLAAAEADLADRGVDTVSLEVLADNEAARRFYRRHGYEPHRLELAKSVESDTHSKE